MLRLHVSNFKSIRRRLQLDLSPLTILLGPPGGGKSNILDAIALAGYVNRISLLDKEYGNSGANLENPRFIARFEQHSHLFSYHTLTKNIKIALSNTDVELSMELYYEGGKIHIKINDVPIPWDIVSLPSNPMDNVRNALKKAEEKHPLIGARLYSYDRYDEIQKFYQYLKNVGVRNFPQNILSELGWNVTKITPTFFDVIVELNESLQESLEEKIEIKRLRTGAIIVFDYHEEVDPFSFSDSLFRILYYTLALKSTTNYVKLYGLEKRFIVLLEEPESHIFPFLLDFLAKYIGQLVNMAYVIITTHNPLFVSVLWDRLKGVKTYYVHRDSKGITVADELDIDKLTKDITLPEEIMRMPTSEVVRKYSKKKTSIVEKKG